MGGKRRGSRAAGLELFRAPECRWLKTSCLTRLSDELPGPLEVGGSIDTEGNSVNDGNVNPHAIFQGPELFQTLTGFERGWIK